MPTAEDYGFDHIISAEMEEELGFDLMFEAPTDGDMIDVVAGLKEDGSSVIDDEVDFDELHQEDDDDTDADDIGGELGGDHDTDNAPDGAEGTEDQHDAELALGEDGDCPDCNFYDDTNNGLGDNEGLGFNSGLGDNDGLGDNTGLDEALGMAGNDFDGADHPGGDDGTQTGEDDPENAANFEDNSLNEALGMAGNDFTGAEHPGSDDDDDDEGSLDDGDYNDSDLIDQVMGDE